MIIDNEDIVFAWRKFLFLIVAVVFFPLSKDVLALKTIKNVYQINGVKDGKGNVLSSVKVYVDDQYIHHYVPETLEFCDGCYCDNDKEVNCGFGEHTIRLEKGGYQDWVKTRVFEIEENLLEANPVMFLLITPSVIPSSTNTPTPIPTQMFTPTPTLTPMPARATYQINSVKNENGDILSSVKIYVDDQYLHHYAPEVLEFCDGCYCDNDKEVNCGLGEHTIRLEKGGYQDWNETKTINAGDLIVDPVMISSLLLTPTPIVVSTISTTVSLPTPTALPSWPKPSLVLKVYSLVKNASPEPEVLGKQSAKQEEALPPLLFWGGGIFYIVFPVYQLKRRWYNNFNEKDFVLD